jgi:hypothetical protein
MHDLTAGPSSTKNIGCPTLNVSVGPTAPSGARLALKPSAELRLEFPTVKRWPRYTVIQYPKTEIKPVYRLLLEHLALTEDQILYEGSRQVQTKAGWPESDKLGSLGKPQ